jgi:hypothetical protein
MLDAAHARQEDRHRPALECVSSGILLKDFVTMALREKLAWTSAAALAQILYNTEADSRRQVRSGLDAYLGGRRPDEHSPAAVGAAEHRGREALFGLVKDLGT